jgi:hypothetical protein
MVMAKHQSHLDAVGEQPKAAMDCARSLSQLLLREIGTSMMGTDYHNHVATSCNQAAVNCHRLNNILNSDSWLNLRK